MSYEHCDKHDADATNGCVKCIEEEDARVANAMALQRSKEGRAMKERLEIAASRAARLLASTEEMNARIADVERVLVTLNLGVSAGVELQCGEATRLSFGRLGKAWSLYTLDAEHRRSPLSSAPREVRVAACDKLPALIEALLAQVDRDIEAVTTAIAALDALLAALGVARP